MECAARGAPALERQTHWADRERGRNGTGTMGWILFEAGVALLLLVAIVWWTMASTRRRSRPDAARPPDEPRGRD
jgi:hypothetical protein